MLNNINKIIKFQNITCKLLKKHIKKSVSFRSSCARIFILLSLFFVFAVFLGFKMDFKFIIDFCKSKRIPEKASTIFSQINFCGNLNRSREIIIINHTKKSDALQCFVDLSCLCAATS